MGWLSTPRKSRRVKIDRHPAAIPLWRKQSKKQKKKSAFQWVPWMKRQKIVFKGWTVYKVELTSIGCGFGQEPYDHFAGIQQTNHFVARCFVIVHFAAAVRKKGQEEISETKRTTKRWDDDTGLDNNTNTTTGTRQNTQQLDRTHNNYGTHKPSFQHHESTFNLRQFILGQLPRQPKFIFDLRSGNVQMFKGHKGQRWYTFFQIHVALLVFLSRAKDTVVQFRRDKFFQPFTKQ